MVLCHSYTNTLGYCITTVVPEITTPPDTPPLLSPPNTASVPPPGSLPLVCSFFVFPSFVQLPSCALPDCLFNYSEASPSVSAASWTPQGPVLLFCPAVSCRRRRPILTRFLFLTYTTIFFLLILKILLASLPIMLFPRYLFLTNHFRMPTEICLASPLKLCNGPDPTFQHGCPC